MGQLGNNNMYDYGTAGPHMETPHTIYGEITTFVW